MSTTAEIVLHLEYLRRALDRWARDGRPAHDDDYRLLIQDEIGLLGEVMLDHPEPTAQYFSDCRKARYGWCGPSPWVLECKAGGACHLASAARRYRYFTDRLDGGRRRAGLRRAVALTRGALVLSLFTVI